MHERPYEKLVAWKESYTLFLFVHALTKKFPADERYCLVTQMRRAAYSAPMNIAEGNRRSSWKEKRRFFEIGLASLEELHCQARMVFDLGYVNREELESLDDRISRTSFLLHRLRESFSNPSSISSSSSFSSVRPQFS